LLVMLHGWGDRAGNLAALGETFELNGGQLWFPDAPFAHPHVPGGRMWYDLQQWDEQGLAQSRQQLHDWLRALPAATGVPLARTVLAGFSQGGAMALDVGLQWPLAGVCSLSGYLHAQPQTATEPPPVLMVHGRQDPVVPLQAAQQAQQALAAAGVALDYRERDMQHELPPPVLEQIREFVLAHT